MISALIGTSTEPVIKNSSMKVANAIRSSAYGSRSVICCSKSMRNAAVPVT